MSTPEASPEDAEVRGYDPVSGTFDLAWPPPAMHKAFPYGPNFAEVDPLKPVQGIVRPAEGGSMGWIKMFRALAAACGLAATAMKRTVAAFLAFESAQRSVSALWPPPAAERPDPWAG